MLSAWWNFLQTKKLGSQMNETCLSGMYHMHGRLLLFFIQIQIFFIMYDPSIEVMVQKVCTNDDADII